MAVTVLQKIIACDMPFVKDILQNFFAATCVLNTIVVHERS